MKICFKCGTSKALSEFYKHGMMADGHLNKCKECTKADEHRKWIDHPKEMRARERERNQTPRRIAQRRRYSKEHTARYPGKKRARSAVSNALRDGRLFREPCERCGSLKVEAHHDDYRKPLEVRWLCIKHHKEIDKRS